MTKITLLCTDPNHPIYAFLTQWKVENDIKYEITLLNRVNEVAVGGDILFLVSCSEIIKVATKSLFSHVLVLHASDLPDGRGWSPHIWDVLAGKQSITLSLLEAEEPVDSGDIWKKHVIPLNGRELFNEINELLFKAELNLIEWACLNYNSCCPTQQLSLNSAAYLRKRTPSDSELNMNDSLESQFNLLRVCDPSRFPAFFYKDGQKYTIRIEKDEK
ncbi:UDP-glucuronic acid dehydrogenase [Colwellia hornerae]|uniref:UDP-glucuronic acid dehydrogenase n=1 Tax=Colwellia hornerae TaxID=89402 RepID=A0A5C6QKG4_9GAMM|nr:UDP-glucuronic acid dehydrogenase [Colwellia hornerae]TWX54033.1 UDP-glucuronic acid dehydrogenase [Colwellia hornerae]TWX60808.1 UDP-glucuronic acid dehydrogenase [Colwellia hornerae]TWX69138.1 UDP-glucuronic acid dehydrogenase [Colwellia hornerae]